MLCQPVAVSLVNVARARSVPEAFQRLPTCVPVFPVPLKNRTPVTQPAVLERNFIPSSTAPPSLDDDSSGASVDVQSPHGQVRTVKLHDFEAASALPERSVTPPAPPETVAVYTPPRVSGEDGCSVAVAVAVL